MIEVDLYLDGRGAFEYDTNAAPQVGWHLDIATDDVEGVYEVTKVSQKLIQRKGSGKIVSYLVVEAKRVHE